MDFMLICGEKEAVWDTFFSSHVVSHPAQPRKYRQKKFIFSLRGRWPISRMILMQNTPYFGTVNDAYLTLVSCYNVQCICDDVSCYILVVIHRTAARRTNKDNNFKQDYKRIKTLFLHGWPIIVCSLFWRLGRPSSHVVLNRVHSTYEFIPLQTVRYKAFWCTTAAETTVLVRAERCLHAFYARSCHFLSIT